MTPTAACLPCCDNSTLNSLANVPSCFDAAVEASLHMKLSETANQSRSTQRKRGDARDSCSEAQRVRHDRPAARSLETGAKLVLSRARRREAAFSALSAFCCPSAACTLHCSFRHASSTRHAFINVTGFGPRLPAVCGLWPQTLQALSSNQKTGADGDDKQHVTASASQAVCNCTS